MNMHPPSNRRRARQELSSPAFADLVAKRITEWVAHRASGGQSVVSGEQISSDGAGFALFVVNLRRPDRGGALARLPAVQQAYDEACLKLAHELRPEDRFARISSDEICLLLPGIVQPAVAMLAAHRVREAFDESPAGLKVRMRPCIGCAFFPEHGDSPEDLFSAADLACREARSLDTAFAISTASISIDTDLLQVELQAALQRNELEVWFQPQFHQARGECLSCEALLRWNGQRGSISPTVIVDLAEQIGLMPDLTSFVLNSALRQQAELRRAGIDLRISINVSASLIGSHDLPELLTRALAIWGVPVTQLTVEVTESSIMHDVARALDIMHEIKRLGMRLSVDDFGTGYSSLAYLRRMPLDELKIDKLFVKNLLQNQGDVSIVRSVIDLAHNFSLEAVAEGVEDAATMQMLLELGCDVIQGYHYAYPMPAQEVPRWWPTRNAQRPGV